MVIWKMSFFMIVWTWKPFKKRTAWDLMLLILKHWLRMVRNSLTSIIKTSKYKLKIFIPFLIPVEQLAHLKELCFHIETSLHFYLHFTIMISSLLIQMFIFPSCQCHTCSNVSLSLALCAMVLKLCNFFSYFQILCWRYA